MDFVYYKSITKALIFLFLITTVVVTIVTFITVVSKAVETGAILTRHDRTGDN